jgi:hypothetical protein
MLPRAEKKYNIRPWILLSIGLIAIIALSSFSSTMYARAQSSDPNNQSTTTCSAPSNPSYSSLAICRINILPKGAKYPVGSWYPAGPLFVRMRMVEGSSWSSTENAQQALSMISQMKPNVLERMTDSVLTPGTLARPVPVCSGCAAMTYLQFLNDATKDCACYIIPRISVGSIDDGIASFEDQAQTLYNTPVNQPFKILSIDYWQEDCKSDPHFHCDSCSWDQSVFQPLYAMGWKGVGVLEGAGANGYYSTCGWATFVDFDINNLDWTLPVKLISIIHSDPTVEKILMYDPDFPGQAQDLQNTCSSGSSSKQLHGCSFVASQLTYAAENQQKYGYSYVYQIEETFWDSNRMFKGSTSIYHIEIGLMHKYN